MSLGVTPAASLGHSIGEFVSACLAEVFSLEDALRAVAARGRLMQSMPAGAMLAVMTPAEQLEPLLPPSISIAAINTPAASVDIGSERRHRGIRTGPARAGNFHNSAAYLARVPLRHDGCGGRAVRRGHARHQAQPAAARLTFPTSPASGLPTSKRPIRPIGASTCGRPCSSTKGLSVIHDQMPGCFSRGWAGPQSDHLGAITCSARWRGT